MGCVCDAFGGLLLGGIAVGGGLERGACDLVGLGKREGGG